MQWRASWKGELSAWGRGGFIFWGNWVAGQAANTCKVGHLIAAVTVEIIPTTKKAGWV